MVKHTIRKYTLEFKQQAAELAIKIGATKAATQLGVSVANVQRWKTDLKKSKLPEEKVKVNLEEENRRLKEEVTELKKVNHILKAAAAFFSQDHLK